MMWLQLTSEKSRDICTRSRDCTCDICTKSPDCMRDICTRSRDCMCDICTKSHDCMCDIYTKSRDCTCDICTKSRDCTCDICTRSRDCTCDICTRSRDCMCDICTKSRDCVMFVQIYILLMCIYSYYHISGDYPNIKQFRKRICYSNSCCFSFLNYGCESLIKTECKDKMQRSMRFFFKIKSQFCISDFFISKATINLRNLNLFLHRNSTCM
jgi:hypothetical protein